MKAAARIISSYFHRRVVVWFLILCTIYLLVISLALLPKDPKISWAFQLYACSVAAAVCGSNLKQMAESSAADLLPNYKSYQLIAAGLILAFFLVLSVPLAWLSGIPVFATMAAVLIHLLFRWTSWRGLVLLCIWGCVLSFIQISLSVLAGCRLKTAHAFGWLMANLVAAVPMIFLVKLYSRIGTIIGVGFVLSLLLFALALRRWEQAELDFQ